MSLIIMQAMPLLLVVVLAGFAFSDSRHDKELMPNKETVSPKQGNTTLETSHQKPNHTRTHLFIFSFTIFKRNSTRNNSKGMAGLQNSPGTMWQAASPDAENPEEQTTLYGRRIHIPLLKDIPMRFLYLIASSCLLVVFLMIIKLVVSRRGKKDYSLVTKGDFDAWV